MTCLEAISRIDELKPNTYTMTQKRLWLEDAEREVTGIIAAAFCEEAMQDPGSLHGMICHNETPGELLVPAPYDQLYLYYLAAQMDLFNGELDLYNRSATLYNTLRQDFLRHCIRSHRGLPTRIRFF